MKALFERLAKIVIEQVDVGVEREAGRVMAPSQRCTCTTLRPSANSREATVCRKVWKPAHETPALSHAGARTLVATGLLLAELEPATRYLEVGVALGDRAAIRGPERTANLKRCGRVRIGRLQLDVAPRRLHGGRHRLCGSARL
jgi:hypothetical protein